MDRRVQKHGFRRLTSWSAEPAVDHGLQTGDVWGRRCWRQVGGGRPGIQEPCCADTCTPGRTAGTGSGQWHRASVEHGAGSESVVGRTCRSLTRLVENTLQLGCRLLRRASRPVVDAVDDERVNQCGDRWSHHEHSYYISRPPGTVVPGGLMFYCWCFFCLFSTRDLRAPSADRRETLPRDLKVLVFYNPGPKILGALPPKMLGPKNLYLLTKLIDCSFMILPILNCATTPCCFSQHFVKSFRISSHIDHFATTSWVWSAYGWRLIHVQAIVDSNHDTQARTQFTLSSDAASPTTEERKPD